ncbi:hypothetical protein BSL78_25259 [Apostichopus japonicus]|uniref:Ig-like domain-containing protein n=1 Tax=Stichopus japonicus TaxID=307972 RepID=A0A2G8JQB0_STIJA|nr:hypothetical protein BSL78_25259 [Apostichopus japonicus]
MGSIYRLCAITLLLITIDQVLCESQEVYFEIKDGYLNEVIFIGEKNITLICHVSDTLHANVTINKVGEGSVATNGGIGNCLEYNIQQVTEQYGGNYACTSRYEDKNTGRMVEMSRMLSLNVKDNQSATCLRNGTGIQKFYSVGDVLLLSCYCDVSVECNWIKSVEGSRVGTSILPMEVLQTNGKVIRRIVVGPLTSMNLTTRYDCLFGSSLDERCSIGPANVSINDEVSLFIPQSDLSKGCPLSVTPTPGIFSGSTEKTRGGQSLPEKSDDFLIYIVIGVCILVAIFLVVLFLFIIFMNRRNVQGMSYRQKLVMVLNNL